jgi:triphosphoribosyl-dephospho-CoA synthase
VLETLDVNETVLYFNAINLAKPGGLLPVEKLDVLDPGTLDEIRTNNISVKDWMQVSSDNNSVSFEYLNDYRLTFDVGLVYFTSMQSADEPIGINEMILRLYLKFLSERLDSLVLGKFDENTAKYVQVEGRKLLGMFESKDPQAQAYSESLNADLAAKKINPGMSADLTASTLFVALTMGLKV